MKSRRQQMLDRQEYMERQLQPEAGHFAVVSDDYLLMYAVSTFSQDYPIIGVVIKAGENALEWARENLIWQHPYHHQLWLMSPGGLHEFLDEVYVRLPEKAQPKVKPRRKSKSQPKAKLKRFRDLRPKSEP